MSAAVVRLTVIGIEFALIIVFDKMTGFRTLSLFLRIADRAEEKTLDLLFFPYITIRSSYFIYTYLYYCLSYMRTLYHTSQ